ncbi:MAG: hypothetical protein A3F90_13120 [Deltaproteobacteria bacterium RIFCSPLOWO2_12_FULL_60_19]|nr:MAG: hypothetical protein A3F90_13120 [Deltaproteobacteria bacterium RIFCSPLOWO2_12_FULL_60_19]
MEQTSRPSFDGLTVASFESRRSREMAELIQRYGGKALLAPAMREIPLSENSAAFEFMRRLQAGQVDIVILLTGVGTRTLLQALATTYAGTDVAEALKRAILVARGPKPVAALKEIGLQPSLTIPEPNTWKEILSTLRQFGALQGKRIALQEYGVTNVELIAGLRALGAEVFAVPVYRWALPEDVGPLSAAIQEIQAGRAEIALFTNAVQIRHLFQVAASAGQEEALRQSLRGVVLGSIGPVCSEALREAGLAPDLEPEHPKMGHLVAAAAGGYKKHFESKRLKAKP